MPAHVADESRNRGCAENGRGKVAFARTRVAPFSAAPAAHGMSREIVSRACAYMAGRSYVQYVNRAPYRHLEASATPVATSVQ